MKMVMQRDFTLSSTLGHTIFFPKGEAVEVPFNVCEEAASRGAVPADEDDAKVLFKEPEAPPADPAGQDRLAKIDETIAAMRKTNTRGEFSAAGMPLVAAVEKHAGFKVSAQEIAAAVARLADDK